jgi:hypothetical protein
VRVEVGASSSRRRGPQRRKPSTNASGHGRVLVGWLFREEDEEGQRKKGPLGGRQPDSKSLKGYCSGEPNFSEVSSPSHAQLKKR